MHLKQAFKCIKIGLNVNLYGGYYEKEDNNYIVYSSCFYFYRSAYDKDIDNVG